MNFVRMKTVKNALLSLFLILVPFSLVSCCGLSDLTKTILQDYTVWGYVSLVVISLYGFLLFCWGLFDAKRSGVKSVGMMYYTILLLFASVLYINAVNLYTRAYRYCDPDFVRDFLLNSPYWPLRLLPEILLLLFIVVKMTLRLYKRHHHKHRRVGDK